uniref:Ku domain-containing protein n=1 Tax=Parastrongyloides trichosuri TaxID=131310 RepID=A0A0N4Z7E3_PARTI
MSILEGHSYVFFDGNFLRIKDFERGKKILKKLLINKLMMLNGEFIQLYSNMISLCGFKRLFAKENVEDFFEINNIMDKTVYSIDSGLLDDIFYIALRLLESGKITTGLKRGEPVNFFFISDLSTVHLSKDQIHKFMSFMPKIPLFVYIFGTDQVIEGSSSEQKKLILEVLMPKKCCTFDESDNLFKYFDPPLPKAANAKFDFQISQDFYMPLTGYLNQPQLKDNYRIINTSPEESYKQLKRKIVYVEDNRDKSVEPCHVIEAYKYGTKLIPYNFFDEFYNSIPLENKSLKLIQFAPKSDIDLAYLQGPIYHMYLDNGKDHKIIKASIEIIKAMIECNVVAIGKRVQSRNAKPKVVIMYPHYSKEKNEVMFTVYLSVFKDDIELMDSPFYAKGSKILTTEEEELMDSYIDAMTLPSNDNRFKPEYTYDPYYQSKLNTIISKAHEESEHELFDRMHDVKNILSPDPEMVKRCESIEEKLLMHYTSLNLHEDMLQFNIETI